MAIPFKILFFSILLLTFLACATKTPVASPSTDIDPPDNTPRIIFLGYNLQEDEAGSVEIKMINKIISKGSLKEQAQAHSTERDGDLKCIAFDQQEQALSYLILPNPLRQSVEFEDENGNLARKEVKLEQADFFIRMQLDPKTESITIEQIGTPENKHLITTKIKNE